MERFADAIERYTGKVTILIRTRNSLAIAIGIAIAIEFIAMTDFFDFDPDSDTDSDPPTHPDGMIFPHRFVVSYATTSMLGGGNG